MIAIDKLCYQSKLRYENAGVKFAFAGATLLICVVSRSPVIAGITLAVNGILTVYKGGIPLFRYLKYLTVPLAFLIFSTIAILVRYREIPLDLFAIPIGNHYLTGSWNSLKYAGQLIFTALAAVSCLYFLSFHTPMPDILNVLRAMHCPRILIELMLLIYRYIFVLLDTASAITTAQHSRLGNRNYRTSLKSFGNMVSVLFIRAMKRSGALYDAMEARCYDGEIRVLKENYPPRKKAIAAVILYEAALLLIWLLERG